MNQHRQYKGKPIEVEEKEPEEIVKLSSYFFEVSDNLKKAMATLITFNHTDVKNYSWEFFKTSLESLAETQEQLSKFASISVANGVGLAFADENERRDFIE